jgi:broad specificity phosphatase PhoE
MNSLHFHEPTKILWQPPRVYLCRHATPDWSRTDIRYDVPPGPPLLAQGEAEAAHLGDFLRQAGVYKLYYSPLERTKRTALIAAERAGAAAHEDAQLAEWRHGEDGKTVLERIRALWENAVQESSQNAPIALVTHGGPVAALLEDLKLDIAELNFYRNQFDRHNPLPPAGAWLTTRSSHDVRWQLELAFTPTPAKRYAPQTIYV